MYSIFPDNRKKTYRPPILSRLVILILLTLAMLILAGVIFNCWFLWKLDIHADDVKSFLIGLFQTLTGVLAIAVSFSLFYIQVTVDAYSLRAANLLGELRSFWSLISYYVFALIFVASLSFSISKDPSWMPTAAAGIGLLIFIGSIFSLISYVLAVSKEITPEAIVNRLIKAQPSDEYLHNVLIYFDQKNEESYQNTYYKKYDRARAIKFPVPVDPQALANYYRELRITIDIARRMIFQNDYTGLQASLRFIKYIPAPHHNRSWKIPLNWEESIHNSYTLSKVSEENLNENTEKESDVAIDSERMEAAVISYHIGALMELWSIVVRHCDPIAASILVETMEFILKSQYSLYSVFTVVFPYTDILDGIIANHILEDCTRLGWSELRRRTLRFVETQLRIYFELFTRSTIVTYQNDRLKYARFRPKDIYLNENDDFILWIDNSPQDPPPTRDQIWVLPVEIERIHAGDDLLKLIIRFYDILLKDSEPDHYSLQEIQNMLSTLSWWAILSKDESLVISIIEALRYQFEKHKSPLWKTFLVNENHFAELIGDLGVHWISGIAAGLYDSNYLRDIKLLFEVFFTTTKDIKENTRDSFIGYSAYFYSFEVILLEMVEAKLIDESHDFVMELCKFYGNQWGRDNYLYQLLQHPSILSDEFGIKLWLKAFNSIADFDEVTDHYDYYLKIRESLAQIINERSNNYSQDLLEQLTEAMRKLDRLLK